MKGRLARLLLPLATTKSCPTIPVGVVLAEGLDEVGTDDRGVVRTEVVREAVCEPGEEVGGQVTQNSEDRHEPQVAEAEDPLVDVHGYQRQKQ